jgi:hypothetical protein
MRRGSAQSAQSAVKPLPPSVTTRKSSFAPSSETSMSTLWFGVLIVDDLGLEERLRGCEDERGSEEGEQDDLHARARVRRCEECAISEMDGTPLVFGLGKKGALGVNPREHSPRLGTLGLHDASPLGLGGRRFVSWTSRRRPDAAFASGASPNRTRSGADHFTSHPRRDGWRGVFAARCGRGRGGSSRRGGTSSKWCKFPHRGGLCGHAG